MDPTTPPPRVAILRRLDGEGWPLWVRGVKTPATLTLNGADLIVTAEALQPLAVTLATLDAWATTHGVSYSYHAHGQELGRGGALPHRRAGGAIAGEGDEPPVEV
jgi:hypothetical protein